MAFVDREDELSSLARWWALPGGRIGLVWGRRRVGKTALLQRFAEGRRHIFHTATGRSPADELRTLARTTTRQLRLHGGDAGPHGHAAMSALAFRDLDARPFADWVDTLETLSAAAASEPLLLVLDEFPELVRGDPNLPATIRATWDRIRERTDLRILISGSAVRVMQAIQEERSPLYGRLDLSLLLHPFRPHEAALMLPSLSPSDRALVWGVVGGVPLYLQWWDEGRSVRDNLAELAAEPGGRLLTEGQNVLAADIDAGELGRRVLFAIASGRTRYEEIKTAISAEPARTLERLVELRLVEKVSPVTDDTRQGRRRSYRIVDNFLAFFLGVLDPYRAEIERGLGRTVLNVILRSLDEHMGPRWEEAFRMHLRRLAAAGDLGDDVVAIGPWWASAGPEQAEIDAVVLAGRGREATLVGEAKWARNADAGRLRAVLERKSRGLPRRSGSLRYAVAARESVGGGGVLPITAADIFGP